MIIVHFICAGFVVCYNTKITNCSELCIPSWKLLVEKWVWEAGLCYWIVVCMFFASPHLIGMWPLGLWHITCCSQHPASVFLIPLSFYQNGLNALHLASKEGHVEVVSELIQRGANVDAATKVSLISKCSTVFVHICKVWASWMQAVSQNQACNWIPKHSGF